MVIYINWSKQYNDEKARQIFNRYFLKIRISRDTSVCDTPDEMHIEGAPMSKCRNCSNRTMLDTVTVLLDPVKHQQDWDEVLPYAIMAYRSSVVRTGIHWRNAARYVIRRRLWNCQLLIFGILRPTPKKIHRKNSPQIIVRNCDGNWELRTKEREKFWKWRQGDRREIMAKVLLLEWNPLHLDHLYGFIMKFARNIPYLVIDKLSDVMYRIQKSPHSKPKLIVHYDRLKPYEGEEVHNWLS